MATLAPALQPLQQRHYHSHSVVEDATDDERDDDDPMDEDLTLDQQSFYQQQQQQAMYYQQHRQQLQQQQHLQEHAGHPEAGPGPQGQSQGGEEGGEEEYSDGDDSSSVASIPDENIDFSLTYALHTFLATVEGQASVVKGDSLLLLDDANSYWWLVRVLKTEDVGYIPAENIETPHERLARLNKHRNVDLAAATLEEKSAVQGREKFKGFITGKAKSIKAEKSGAKTDDAGPRRVVFAPPTYVDHPGVTWSSDEEDQSYEEGDSADEEPDEGEEGRLDGRSEAGDRQDENAGVGAGRSVSASADMEPDDGVEWADDAAVEAQKRQMERRGPQPQTNNPFAQQRADPSATESGIGITASTSGSTTSLSSAGGMLDPAQASNDTRRITATPALAQGQNGQLLPSAMGQQHVVSRKVSASSVTSTVSAGTARSATPTSSPQDEGGKKMKKTRKENKEESDGEKKKGKGVLGGLFSRSKGKSKRVASGSDPRTSEESVGSGATELSPASQGRASEESPRQRNRAIGEAPGPVVHSTRLQQRDQAVQQAYTDKYLNRPSGGPDGHSPTAAEAVAAVAQSAAAMRLAASLGGSSGRPTSIILSPNPAGPPLLNVTRLFAGEHIRSEASFKTVLLNENTSSTDLIRQAMQRFHLHGASRPGADADFYLTIKDVTGEETELGPDEKPLVVFQDAVQRWTFVQDESKTMDDFTPRIKRSSVGSISSIVSLSSHPAIAKLGMSDFSDDSAVKIYLHRRRPGSVQIHGGMPDPSSEFSSYSTQLSTVHESSPEGKNSEWSSTVDSPSRRSTVSDRTASPPTPQPRFHPSLNVAAGGHGSPERFTSPSARFTVQIVIHPGDLPDGSVFDPSGDAIVPRAIVKDRQPNGSSANPNDFRRRVFILPRNAPVLEAIEQGLDRFGIQEGVVDGGDDVEDKVGNRRVGAKVRYSLAAAIGSEERHLAPSSKVLDAYPSTPNLRPAERSTIESRRRSRDFSQNAGSLSDILPTDPVFVLRRVGSRSSAHNEARRMSLGPMQRQQQQPPTSTGTTVKPVESRSPLSPQEIIAAQRAASRANQNAIISAHANMSQGVDVVVPDRGTFRSSRLMEPTGEVVRYSYIDGDGETYDISELLEEEWGETESPDILQAPSFFRTATDSSTYVTAPSTPEPQANLPLPGKGEPGYRGSQDILQGVIQRAAGQPARLEERLQRVINKVKSSSSRRSITGDDTSPATGPSSGRSTPPDRNTPQPQPPQGRLSPLPEGKTADATPRASEPRSSSRQNYHQTAATVNRIISRHRQQPSIASIISTSDFSGPLGQEDEPSTGTGPGTGSGGTSTPMTATSSTHPTPPLTNSYASNSYSHPTSHPYTASYKGSGHGAIFTPPPNSHSPNPLPRTPVLYKDDFGIKALMSTIYARAHEEKSRQRPSVRDQVDDVQRLFWGEKVGEGEVVHPGIRGCFEGLQDRLDRLDAEIERLLAGLVGVK